MKESSDFPIKVDINLKSVQNNGGLLPEVMEFFTNGEMSPTERMGKKGWKLSYKDSGLTGFPGSMSELICINGNYARMVRTGDVTQNITMERDKRTNCDYNTEYGNLSLGVFAHTIQDNLSDKGGDIYLHYTIDSNGSFIGENQIYLKVTPSKNGTNTKKKQ